jgi:hypothetical protein
MLPSIAGMGAKLDEGMGAVDFQLNDMRPTDFWPRDLVSNIE